MIFIYQNRFLFLLIFLLLKLKLISLLLIGGEMDAAIETILDIIPLLEDVSCLFFYFLNLIILFFLLIESKI
jgi:hypothetical protein